MYEFLMNKSSKAFWKAQNTKDPELKKFFYNASVGFAIKANKLAIEEAVYENN